MQSVGMETPDDNNQPDLSAKERLDRIGRVEVKPRDHGYRHSRFIRKARIILPVIALILIGAVFLWTERESAIVPLTLEELAAKDTIEEYVDPLAPESTEPEDLTVKTEIVPPPFPEQQNTISQRLNEPTETNTIPENIDLPAAITEQPSPQISKNELTNPRFESKDSRGQPFTITAQKAVQGQDNDGVLELEKPVADILLKSGAWLAISAEHGAYTEEVQSLKLQGDVRLFHDTGYELKTAQLDLDMLEAKAISNQDVYIQGPAGTLTAKGLKGDQTIGKLSFTGPAKLTLYDAGNMSLGRLK